MSPLDTRPDRHDGPPRRTNARLAFWQGIMFGVAVGVLLGAWLVTR